MKRNLITFAGRPYVKTIIDYIYVCVDSTKGIAFLEDFNKMYSLYPNLGGNMLELYQKARLRNGNLYLDV